jgi:hypothetical protein
MRDPRLLLEAWTTAASEPEPGRGAAVLAAAGLLGTDDPLDVPLAAVAELARRCHVEVFGARVSAEALCACGSRLELDLDLTAVGAQAAPAPPCTALELDGRTVTVRAPTTRDLVAAARSPEARTEILARCVAGDDGTPMRPQDLTAAELDRVDDTLEVLSGSALVALVSRCPDCDGPVDALLDPADLLWQRVRLAAPAVLGEVARLAAAFGWREDDVLDLPPVRRRAYLELVGELVAG